MKELALKELQSLELEILKDIHDFCVDNDIKYSLYGGSALGAVRHSGFIPWDDDIDIVMPRLDYEKFRMTYKSNRFQYIDRRDDKKSMIAFSRVCDNNRTVSKSNDPWHRGKTGVWVDIFPADGYNSSDMELYRKCVELRRKSLKYRKAFCSFDMSKGLKYNLKLVAKKILFRKHAGEIVDQLIKESMKYKFGEEDSWAVLCCPYAKRTIHPISSFNDVKLTKFNSYHFFLLNGYEIMLSNVYGDYMQLPPVEKRVPPMSSTDFFYWK